MTNINVIENKISSVKKYLKTLSAYQEYTKNQIENDIKIKGSLERYLYLSAQAAIDLAEAVIAYKKLRKPTTQSEAFDILNEEKIITSPMREELVKMVGLRNIIAHDYEKIDYDILYNVLKNKLPVISNFSKIISRKYCG